MTRLARLAAAILLASIAVGAGPSPTSGPGTLSAKERAARIEALAEDDRRWLTDLVAPIVTPEEERIFLDLATPRQRDRFRTEFWRVRERDGLPYPRGPNYRRRYEDLRRAADATYDGWRNDAGRMVIVNGEPASIATLEACKGTFRDLEIWTYGAQPGRPAFRRFFFRQQPQAPRRLWTVGVEDAEVLSPGSCYKSFNSMVRSCRRTEKDPCAGADCNELCGIYMLWEELRAGHSRVTGGMEDRARWLEAPTVTAEDLQQLRAAFQDSAVTPTLPSISARPAPTPAPKAAAASTSQPGRVPKLSGREKAARIKDLSDDDRRWLTDFVEPIILPDETNLFLQLPAGYPREMFREEFWKRRERDGLPPPFGPGYRSRYEHLLEIADSEYEGRFGDAGRMVIRRGEPSGIEDLKDCSEVYRQAEIWIYPPRGTGSHEETHLFYRPSFGAPRRLWLPGDTEIFQTASCLASFDQACAIMSNGAPPSGGVPCGGGQTVPQTCRAACAVSRVAEEIRSRGPAAESAAASFAPPVSTEGLDQLWQRLATSVDPGARHIDLQGPSGASSAPRPAAAPEPASAAWTSDVIRDRIIALPKKYRDFLDVAAPIMSGSELVAFLGAKPGDRDGFIRKFWRQHSKKG